MRTFITAFRSAPDMSRYTALVTSRSRDASSTSPNTSSRTVAANPLGMPRCLTAKQLRFFFPSRLAKSPSAIATYFFTSSSGGGGRGGAPSSETPASFRPSQSTSSSAAVASKASEKGAFSKSAARLARRITARQSSPSHFVSSPATPHATYGASFSGAFPEPLFEPTCAAASANRPRACSPRVLITSSVFPRTSFANVSATTARRAAAGPSARVTNETLCSSSSRSLLSVATCA